MSGVLDWMRLAREQAGALREGLLARQRGADTSTEQTETTPKPETPGANTQPAMPPLSAEEWTSLMDSDGRFSDDNAKEVMRHAFYGVRSCLFSQNNMKHTHVVQCHTGLFGDHPQRGVEVPAAHVPIQLNKRSAACH